VQLAAAAAVAVPNRAGRTNSIVNTNVVHGGEFMCEADDGIFWLSVPVLVLPDRRGYRKQIMMHFAYWY